ncbi:MAG: biosynthetic-type acetolactate synthase large subunit [Dehalococcoidia bacterium]
MKLSGSQIVCECLKQEGGEVMVGRPGGAILPFYQPLPEYPALRHSLVRHEEGAAMAADGFARATGKVGVCVATSGPGATNLVTGIMTAQMDSAPIVAITGQVPRAMIGKDAFQETDVTGITLPITKHNYLVMDTRELPRIIKEAFYLARTGRPGPVLIDIPKDVQQDEVEFEGYPDEVEVIGYEPIPEIDPVDLELAARMINEAERPVIIAGRGVNISRAHAELKELAEKAQIPVITTLLGLGAFPGKHVLSFGMPGMHGVAWASIAINESDLLLGIGMRFDDRVTGKVSTFAPKAKKVHVDIDPAEVGKNIKADLALISDVKYVLEKLNPLVERKTHSEWLQQVDRWRQEHPSLKIRETNHLLPQFILKQLNEETKGEAIIVTGVGQHQMWAAQYCFFDEPYRFLSSGGAGTMGYEVPAAMGAQVGCPNDTVWSIAGDGGFQMTMCELATMVQENIPVKYAIMNNGFHGMVRQWQEIFYNKSYVASKFHSPDFVKLAEAFGCVGIRVTEKEQVVPAIRKAMECDGPVIVDFMVRTEENVYPFIPPGESLASMVEDPSVSISMG